MLDTPYAVGSVDAENIRAAGPMVNLSESMARVPGIVVNLRNNYAQDLQISSRGFGARATFGVRGMRLYTDGIPAGTPDGQGQVSHFDLAGAQRIEVLRGPFSVLYGNSSGGVISLVSASPTGNAGELAVDAGSNGTWQIRAGAEGRFEGGFGLKVQGSRFETDGVRPHSEAQRTLGSARLSWDGERDSVVLLLGTLDQPAQDPLGLTREQFDADPYQTDSRATDFDTRKTVDQTQGGLQWRHRFTDWGPLAESRVVAYYGQRAVTQWQAIPPGNQASPRSPGGVIDFDRDYHGLDARLAWRWDAVRAVAGVSVETQQEDRRGFENYVGTPPDRVLGVTGALRRDEQNEARSTDLYGQAEVDLAERWTATAGLRSGKLQLDTSDRYLSNGDDSGSLSFSYTTPVVALRFAPTPRSSVYLSYGRGFESPTLGELAYRPDGAPGWNTELQPQKSRQIELGAKWRGEGVSVDVAAFQAKTENEIGVQTNSGGRSTFQNVGRTERRGIELAGSWQPSESWRTALALTWLDATYTDGFLTCGPPPCTAPSLPVAAGNRIAGTFEKTGFAELVWLPAPRAEIGLELRGQGSQPVNDLNSDFAEGVVVAGLRALYRLPLAGGELELLGRVDNLADEAYAGSVIVNESNGRFFETAAGRTVLVSVRYRIGF